MTGKDGSDEAAISGHRVKKLAKGMCPEVKVTSEAAFVIARAAERFVQELAVRSGSRLVEEGRARMEYDDVELHVHSSEIYEFLYDVVPERVPVAVLTQLCDGIPNTAQMARLLQEVEQQQQQRQRAQQQQQQHQQGQPQPPKQAPSPPHRQQGAAQAVKQPPQQIIQQLQQHTIKLQMAQSQQVKQQMATPSQAVHSAPQQEQFGQGGGGGG